MRDGSASATWPPAALISCTWKDRLTRVGVALFKALTACRGGDPAPHLPRHGYPHALGAPRLAGRSAEAFAGWLGIPAALT